MTYLTDAEPRGFIARRLPGDMHVSDPGVARTLATPRDKVLDGRFGSLGDEFDATVGQVADPAGQASILRLDRGRVAEPDALDTAVDQEMNALDGRLGHGWPRKCNAARAGLAVAALTVASASGQELPRAEPEAMAMSTQGLNAVAAEMDRLVADGEIVGMNAMIARRGRIVFEHATGILDMETNAPMRLDSLIRVYSMTKPITSAGALMLVDDGKLDLDEPVTRFFPEWEGQTAYEGDKIVPADPPVTAKHLLLHTSGLSYGYVGDTPVDKAYRAAGLIDHWDYLVRDTNILVEKLADIPLLFQPGTRWHYSFSTDVLGQLIERISGKPLDAYLDERMFRPLGMQDTYFDVPPDVLDRFGTDHEFKDGKFVVQDSSREDPEFIGVTFLSGGGGLVMPTESYVRFCQAILNGGELNGARILEPATVDLMTTDQLPPGIWPNSGFGLGFAVVTEEGGSTPPGSYSWGGAAGTFFWIDPGNELVAVFMPQYIDMPNAIQEKLKGLVYAAID